MDAFKLTDDEMKEILYVAVAGGGLGYVLASGLVPYTGSLPAWGNAALIASLSYYLSKVLRKFTSTTAAAS